MQKPSRVHYINATNSQKWSSRKSFTSSAIQYFIGSIYRKAINRLHLLYLYFARAPLSGVRLRYIRVSRRFGFPLPMRKKCKSHCITMNKTAVFSRLVSHGVTSSSNDLTADEIGTMKMTMMITMTMTMKMIITMTMTMTISMIITLTTTMQKKKCQ